jgi:hypothetical protein
MPGGVGGREPQGSPLSRLKSGCQKPVVAGFVAEQHCEARKYFHGPLISDKFWVPLILRGGRAAAGLTNSLLDDLEQSWR